MQSRTGRREDSLGPGRGLCQCAMAMAISCAGCAGQLPSMDVSILGWACGNLNMLLSLFVCSLVDGVLLQLWRTAGIGRPLPPTHITSEHTHEPVGRRRGQQRGRAPEDAPIHGRGATSPACRLETWRRASWATRECDLGRGQQPSSPCAPRAVACL